MPRASGAPTSSSPSTPSWLAVVELHHTGKRSPADAEATVVEALTGEGAGRRTKESTASSIDTTTYTPTKQDGEVRCIGAKPREPPPSGMLSAGERFPVPEQR